MFHDDIGIGILLSVYKKGYIDLVEYTDCDHFFDSGYEKKSASKHNLA